jgi:hypothetical protein
VSWKNSLEECTTNDLKTHLEAIADAANIANGDAGVMGYKVQNFKYVDAVKELGEDTKSTRNTFGQFLSTVFDDVSRVVGRLANNLKGSPEEKP